VRTRSLPVFLLTILSCTSLMGQTTAQPAEGSVTFVTTQNVYVKFAPTENIQNGDTLFVMQNDKLIPVLVVKQHSSSSSVCVPLTTRTMAVSDKVLHIARPGQAVSETADPGVQPAVIPPVAPVVPPGQVAADSNYSTAATSKKPQQRISGFTSIGSFTNWSSNTPSNSERLKYTLSFNMRNIGGTGLSAESYIVFSYDNRNWSETQKDIFNGLKIYNLSFNYDFNQHFSLLLGRKINPKLSNMGPVDGLQFEMRYKPISVGLLAGFRPNFYNYGFADTLFQFGGYVYHEYGKKNNLVQTTVGFIDQLNKGKTDRQFIYLQNSTSIIRKLNFFGSVELDLYNHKYNSSDSTVQKSGSPKLTNLYLSLNYRIIKELSVSFSYSARQNVVYYETYKNYLDKMLEEATLQGYMAQVTVRPVNRLSIGITGAYRFMKQDPRPTKNIYGYVSYSQIPGIEITPTVSYTWLETAYIKGQIYSAGISRDFARGKLSMGLSYRYVNYVYGFSETTITQNLAEVDLTWRIIRKLSLSLYYEGTFENVDQFNRIYAQLNYRF
jgi:hypothetical protein